MIKETWMILGQTLLFTVLVLLVLGIIITVGIFFHKVWEFVNTEQSSSVGIIKGNVTIVPNDKGEIYLGNLTVCEGIDIEPQSDKSTLKSVDIKGQGKDKTTVKEGE